MKTHRSVRASIVFVSFYVFHYILGFLWVLLAFMSTFSLALIRGMQVTGINLVVRAERTRRLTQLTEIKLITFWNYSIF